jgi:hypothetical protein
MPESVNALEQYYRDLGPATANPNFLAQGRRANVAQRSMPGPTMQAANTQLAKEFRSMGNRGAIPDLINRGLIANTAGLPVDLVNTVLQSLGLGAEQPVGGSDSIRRALEYYGLSSDTQRPMLETLTGLTPPKAVMGAARAAGQGAEAVGRAAAPVAGQAIENYLVRSGGVLPMDTWHGSPHRFPPTAKNPLGEFDPMKIGTGEGAQSYGVGAAYLAEAPEVAKGYQAKLTAQQKPNVVDTNLQKIYEKTGDWSKAVDEHMRRIYDTPKAKEKMRESLIRQGAPTNVEGGALYKVDLPDEAIAKMLDWDKPLSQQSKEVRGVLQSMMTKARKSFPQIDANGDPIAGQIHHLYAQHRGGNAQVVADELKAAGIPGIRYLDQGSRAGGAGTSNFVVFDPAHMNIIGRE